MPKLITNEYIAKFPQDVVLMCLRYQTSIQQRSYVENALKIDVKRLNDMIKRNTNVMIT